MKPITILIANYEGGDALSLCIESIRARTAYPPGYSIMVYNSPANGRDIERLRAYQADGNLILIEGKENMDHGHAVRRLVTECPTDWGMILDSDSEIIRSDWMTVMAEAVTDDDKIMLVAHHRPAIVEEQFIVSPTYWLACMLLNVRLYKPIADPKDFLERMMPMQDYPWWGQFNILPTRYWDGRLGLETGGWLEGRLSHGEMGDYRAAPMPVPFWPERMIHYGGISRNHFRPEHPEIAPRWVEIRKRLAELRRQCSQS